MPTGPPPDGTGDSSRGALLSRRELAELTGIEITAKHEFILLGERLWHREAGGWREYA